ncbi:hypothetical protein EP331_14530 [bacterium]|nr:MAG: hypothetical protein EP331_14530 [bacterium]
MIQVKHPDIMHKISIFQRKDMGKTEHQLQIRGKIGPLIYYTVKGKQYVRTAPTRVRQPNTAEQLQVRSKFALANALASALHRAMKGWFLESKVESQRAYNQLVKRIQATGIDTSGEEVCYDFERLLLTEGSLADLELTKHAEGISWKLPAQTKANTTVFLIGIHEDSLEVQIHSSAIANQSLNVQTEEKTHFYMFYVQRNNNKEKVSRSVKV